MIQSQKYIFSRLSLLVLIGVLLDRTVSAQNRLEAFKGFLAKPPEMESMKFWLYHTHQKVGHRDWLNFYRLYDCTYGANQFLINYYQKPDGLNLDYQIADYVHLKIGPNYWALSPQDIHYWYDDKSKNVEIQNTLRMSMEADQRLFNQIFTLGITEENHDPIRWEGDNFSIDAEHSTITGELTVSNDCPISIEFSSRNKLNGQINNFKVNYDWTNSPSSSFLPNGYSISRKFGNDWVLHTVVHFLSLRPALLPVDLSTLSVTNLRAEKYKIDPDAKVAYTVYTNNSLQIHNTNGVTTTHTLKPPKGLDAKPVQPGRAFSWRGVAASVLIAAFMAPIGYIMYRRARSGSRQKDL